MNRPLKGTDLKAQIASNVQSIRRRMAAAAERVGRSAAEIQLVAVTKYAGEAEIRALVELGCHELGESRPQQLWERAERLADLPVRWHLIGHLQRNKVRRTLPLLTYLHSGDRLRLLKAVQNELSSQRAASGQVQPLQVFLEVNVSGEATKHGFAPDDLTAAFDALGPLDHLAVRGLMAMAGRDGSPDDARREFALLRELRDRLAKQTPPNVQLEHLSMGMSGDFEVAIEEGATMIRVGSALFEHQA